MYRKYRLPNHNFTKQIANKYTRFFEPGIPVGNENSRKNLAQMQVPLRSSNFQPHFFALAQNQGHAFHHHDCHTIAYWRYFRLVKQSFCCIYNFAIFFRKICNFFAKLQEGPGRPVATGLGFTKLGNYSEASYPGTHQRGLGESRTIIRRRPKFELLRHVSYHRLICSKIRSFRAKLANCILRLNVT